MRTEHGLLEEWMDAKLQARLNSKRYAAGSVGKSVADNHARSQRERMWTQDVIKDRRRRVAGKGDPDQRALDAEGIAGRFGTKPIFSHTLAPGDPAKCYIKPLG